MNDTEDVGGLAVPENRLGQRRRPLQQGGAGFSVSANHNAFEQISGNPEGIVTRQFATPRAQGTHSQRLGGRGTLIEQPRLADAAGTLDHAHLSATAFGRGQHCGQLLELGCALLEFGHGHRAHRNPIRSLLLTPSAADGDGSTAGQ